MFVHYNAGTNSTNKKGCFCSIEWWLNKEEIFNIFSIPKLEGMGFCITYDRMDGNYIVHSKDGEVQFNKNKMVLPYIESKKEDMVFLQTLWESYESFTKKEITEAKLAHKSQLIIGHPYER